MRKIYGISSLVCFGLSFVFINTNADDLVFLTCFVSAWGFAIIYQIKNKH